MIYVVSGLMRSGTTMMMKCIEAGGIPTFYTEDGRGFREPSGADLESVVWNADRIHELNGMAVKLLLGGLYRLPSYRYRMVLMTRDAAEIKDSLERFKKEPEQQYFERAYARTLKGATLMMKVRADVSLSVLDYGDVLANPTEALESLRARGWPINVESAAAIVDPDMRHSRVEDLVYA